MNVSWVFLLDLRFGLCAASKHFSIAAKKGLEPPRGRFMFSVMFIVNLRICESYFGRRGPGSLLGLQGAKPLLCVQTISLFSGAL